LKIIATTSISITKEGLYLLAGRASGGKAVDFNDSVIGGLEKTDFVDSLYFGMPFSSL